ncbi:hypothetical protein ACHAXA_004706 [Cyclostephanos tholiformis]|uniref:protein-serine/threonine phosphatase n=1 Tax=Cyclostephanos tholiformis TaxID=382380 RepID=A0ABD3SSA4_9STRA
MTTPMWIVCANAGDLHVVYSRSSHRADPLSYDHKPNDEDEERRIREAGGYVSGGRVEGDLANAVSGGDGDGDDVPMLRPSEQKISPIPDIIIQNRDPDEDEFIVIACDGIWDVQTNQECVKMVADIFAEGERDLGLVCEEMSCRSDCPTSSLNMRVLQREIGSSLFFILRLQTFSSRKYTHLH